MRIKEKLRGWRQRYKVTRMLRAWAFREQLKALKSWPRRTRYRIKYWFRGRLSKLRNLILLTVQGSLWSPTEPINFDDWWATAYPLYVRARLRAQHKEAPWKKRLPGTGQLRLTKLCLIVPLVLIGVMLIWVLLLQEELTNGQGIIVVAILALYNLLIWMVSKHES